MLNLAVHIVTTKI